MGQRSAVATLLVSYYCAFASASFCDLPGADWQPFWSDEFDGDSLNASSWNVLEGGGEPPALWGCRAAVCLASNVEVGGGTLTLWSRADASVPGFNFSSAAVTSKDKRRWTWVDGAYRVCVSAVLPGYAPPSSGLTGQGYWPAHWLMPNDSSCDPDEGEFDMMEMISGNGRLYSTYHWQDNWPAKPCSFPQGHQEVTANMSLPATWGTDFHEYAVEVSGTHVAFAFDGQTLLNRTTAAGPVPQPLLWPVPFYVFLNTAIGAPHNWPGAPNATTIFPSAHVIDYVRVIQQQKQR